MCIEHYCKEFLDLEDYKYELKEKLKNKELENLYNFILLINRKFVETKFAEIVERYKYAPLSVMENKYPFDTNLNYIKDGEYLSQFIILNTDTNSSNIEISIENAVIYLNRILNINHYLAINLITEMDPYDFDSVSIIDDKNYELIDELQTIQLEIIEKFNIFNKKNYF